MHDNHPAKGDIIHCLYGYCTVLRRWPDSLEVRDKACQVRWVPHWSPYRIIRRKRRVAL